MGAGPRGRCVVLNDRERELLFEIERGLLVEDPEPVRSFGAVRQHNRDTVFVSESKVPEGCV